MSINDIFIHLLDIIIVTIHKENVKRLSIFDQKYFHTSSAVNIIYCMKGGNVLHTRQINCGRPLYGGMKHGNFL